jgi:hypothetical protein
MYIKIFEEMFPNEEERMEKMNEFTKELFGSRFVDDFNKQIARFTKDLKG